MVFLENVVTAAMTAASGALVFIGYRAWLHTRSPKVLLIAAGFLLFLIKGLVLTVGLFTTAAWGENLLAASVTLDLGILMSFYFAIFKRARW